MDCLGDRISECAVLTGLELLVSLASPSQVLGSQVVVCMEAR